MLAPFFALAAVSPSRHKTFRVVVSAHVAGLGILLACMWLTGVRSQRMLLGNVLLTAGIIEGALLVGWRLTQLPKSQALEFLLVTPVRPPLIFLAEALIGLTRLALTTLAALPLLVLLYMEGRLQPVDVLILLALAFTWGAVAGLAMSVWAYESACMRRCGQRVAFIGIITYLVVGVLAGEHLLHWLRQLPPPLGQTLLGAIRSFHDDNPFGVVRLTMEQGAVWTWHLFVRLEILGGLIVLFLLIRGAWRLHGHFQEEHYGPIRLDGKANRPEVGDSPLAWWAVKRVTKYAGRVNLWLAAGFTLLYGVYVLLGDDWPAWLGKQVFLVFDRMGGVPALTTALVLLSAVPAAFQYGLWDSNVHDRRRRLELLLLTHLDGAAYWEAASHAAWHRGKGYFACALFLWIAAGWAGVLTVGQVLLCAAAGVILWGLYFAIGFRAFARGMQANTLGVGLTLVLPLATFLLLGKGFALAGALLPPGSVYYPAQADWQWWWVFGPLAAGGVALSLARHSQEHCDAQLRRWYERSYTSSP